MTGRDLVVSLAPIRPGVIALGGGSPSYVDVFPPLAGEDTSRLGTPRACPGEPRIVDCQRSSIV